MSSCSACAVLAAPPSADRRHPHAQLRCCSSIAPRAGSHEPTRRRRASAEPRARRSFSAPPTSSSARRSCRRARRAPSWPHRRAPTDAILTLSFVAAPPSHPAPAHTSQHDDGERAPSREHVVLLARRRPRRARADRVVVLGVRRPGRTAERRPTPSSRSASLLLLHRTPRRLTRANTTTASERRAASTSFFQRAADLVERTPIVSSCSACAVLAAPPSADRRHPHAQLRCCSSIAPRAGSHEPTRRRRASAEPRARRSFSAPPTSSSARRSCRRARRAPSWPHRRAPTDAILTLSFVAAPPSHPAPAHTSQHDDGERAPSREHVVLLARRRPRRARADRVVVLGVRRPGRTAERRPTPSSRSASLLLLHRTPRRLTRANTTTASERRAASTSFFQRAADLVERAPIVSSCSACAVLAAPPSADRRHPHAQLRCCSSIAPRAGSHEPTRRRRASAEPRARRSFSAPPTSSSARRSCRRARRAPSWPHRRAPTDAILTLSFVAAPPSHPAPAHTSQHDDGERAPSREHVVLLARRRPRRARADRVVVLGVRRPGRTAERRPTPSSRSASLLLLHRTPRRLTRANTTTASERRAASTSFFQRAADLVERAPIVSSCSACAVLAAPPSADRRHPHAQLRCCSSIAPRAGSHEPTRRRRASAEPRARRSFSAPPTSSSARRSCRRARRAPSWPHRRAPTDAILTLSFVAAPPSHPAPAHTSQHDDGERAPSREHVVLSARRRPRRARADRVVVLGVRRPGRTAERRPTPSSRSASLLLLHRTPRRLTRANTTTASERRAASTSFF